MKVSAQLYGQFLLSSQINCTGTYLADHFEGLTHDNVQYFLKASRFAPRQIWQHLRHAIHLDADGYILFDDTVLNKEYSHKIELVRRQYSGNAHAIIKGIGVVNCVYFNPKTNQFWLIDYAFSVLIRMLKLRLTMWSICSTSWLLVRLATKPY